MIRLLAAVTGVVIALAAPARGEPSDVAELAVVIDARLKERWQRAGVRPAGRSSDGEFLRRVTLELAGRIPTAAEARAFLDDPAVDKRGRLVDRLLAGHDHVEHSVRTWRALLVPEYVADLLRPRPTYGFDNWLRARLAANAPYDQFVKELLAAGADRPGGRPVSFPEATEPLAFYEAKGMKPEDVASAAARLFLGVSLECAQCHDHPCADWTRRQFWSFAALFAGPRGLTIPGGGEVARAAYLDGTTPHLQDGAGPRLALADWLASPKNPYFSRAAVNRVWESFFGVGLVDPVDDLREENPPSHPELLDELAAGFTRSGFDVRFLVRAITASEAYQLSSAGRSGEAPPDPRLFARMAVKAMTAEQLLDSLTQVTGYRPARDRRIDERAAFLAKFAHPGQPLTDARLTTPQALALMNGRLTAAQANMVKGRTLRDLLLRTDLDAVGKLEEMYLMTLSRRPTGEELARLRRFVADRPHGEVRALEDVFWVLLNSPEFLLNH